MDGPRVMDRAGIAAGTRSSTDISRHRIHSLGTRRRPASNCRELGRALELAESQRTQGSGGEQERAISLRGSVIVLRTNGRPAA